MTCTICPNTAPEGEHLCPLCTDDLRGWLAELAHQARLLEAFLVPGASPAAGRTGGTGRAHAPLPVDLRVLALLGPGSLDAPADPEEPEDLPIRTRLAGWAGRIAYSYRAARTDQAGTQYVTRCTQAVPRRGATIPGWCAWLTAYLPYTVTRPWAADLHRQIGDLVHRLRDLTQSTARTHAFAAPCPSCEACALTRTDGQWHIRCQLCDHQLTPEEYDQHVAEVLQAQHDADTSGRLTA
jgi:hypothetical protein